MPPTLRGPDNLTEHQSGAQRTPWEPEYPPGVREETPGATGPDGLLRRGQPPNRRCQDTKCLTISSKPNGSRTETPGHKVPEGLRREVSSQGGAKYAAKELIRHLRKCTSPEGASEL